ncbi:hypothetical protein AQUCO_02000162v1 [Aquilegia coerulea]|uniref:Uncharacterized protein n=1 Tax=Aquilegia coerulea TaxID=218851 RepID=A0A2G5DG93_AQUCA|nr:hypothetical protein AQUCO_02000162v1 [Aquilegia coerulea]PIA42513.1 hypothetical protein AQUCO_02000162v1 [Aquilegia coerulea]PIA42514.1 hypothetical protein AQUCO_02000162v1 [Aquilegia coerulea]
MPKERKLRSLSSDRSKTSPYPCSSKSLQSLPEPLLEDVKEWEQARCPVCMEHPHNAVLLLCSSHEKGCRPYMCDTSYRHSNCLDQFRKSFAENSPTMPLQEETSNSSMSAPVMRSETGMHLPEERNLEEALDELGPAPNTPCESQVQHKLVCPLCRGQINGWIVMETARRFMNCKARSCACETCEYNGTYADLRKHARVEHPLVRPSEVDPDRQHAWRTLERERDLGDVLSTMRSALLEERDADGIFEGASDSIFTSEEGSLLTVFFLFRVFRPESDSGSGGSSSSSSRWSTFARSRGQFGPSRSRGQSRSQRRTGTLWGENFDTDTDSAAREDDNGSSESVPDSRRHNERNRR